MQPLTIVPLGAPGLGKSTLAASICEVVDPERVCLIVTKPGEERSFGYRRYGLKPELFFDKGWIPTLKRYEGGGYIRLLQRLVDLYDDDHYDAVIIDTGTDVINLIEHFIVGPHNVGGFGELKEPRSAYRQLADTAQEFVLTASTLSSQGVKRPKWVIIPWHVQPAKEGQYSKQGDKQESADERAQGIEYEGLVLPQLEGAYRRKLAADVDVVVYCDIETKKNLRTGEQTVEYFIVAAPDKDRHAKVRASMTLKGRIPNSMPALIAAMEEANK